jgi:hypothetical protein
MTVANWIELSSDQADLILTTLNKVADEFIGETDTADEHQLISNVLAKVADELGISV